MKDQNAFCHGWEFTNSVDYFSTEYVIQDGSSRYATAPMNFAGYQQAQDGNAYLDIDKQNWTKVSYFYKANGGEKYFTIGNCPNCSTKKQYRKIILDRKTARRPNNDKYSAYYYIDNVSIRKQE